MTPPIEHFRHAPVMRPMLQYCIALLQNLAVAALLTQQCSVDIYGLKPQTSTHEDGDSDSDNEGEVCNPPLTRIPRGRPKKKRMDKAAYRASWC